MKADIIKKSALMAIVAMWGAVTFLCVFAEDNPESPMSLASFIMIKAVALASFVGLVKFCQTASKKGLL